MPQDADFIQRLCLMLGKAKFDERETNIIRHYHRQMERGVMTRNTALDRCCGDIKGWNWHPTRCYGNTIRGE
jgi:hypothetical protein